MNTNFSLQNSSFRIAKRSCYDRNYNFRRKYYSTSKCYPSSFSKSRTIYMKMGTSFQSSGSFLNNTALSPKKIKGMHESLLSSNLKSFFSDPENVNPENYKTCKKMSKERNSCLNLSMKSSKNISCHINRQIQILENDSILFFDKKSVKKNIQVKSSSKSESVKRSHFKDKLSSKNAKLHLDIPTDTLILCIDDEEAADILFGDIKKQK